MPKKNRLQRILAALSPDGTEVDFSQFDKAIEDLKSGLKEKVQAKTLDDVNTRIDAFRKSVDLSPLQDALKGIETNVDIKVRDIKGQLESEFEKVRDASASDKWTSDTQLLEIGQTISDLSYKLDTLQRQKDTDIKDLKVQLDTLPPLFKRIDTALGELKAEATTYRADDTKADQESVKALTDEIETLRRELTNRINNLPRGGNANRNIAIGGNVAALSKYGDINLKAGSNVTLAYANNETTKYLDITISASGTGSGITREIDSISTNTNAAAVASIDYVYLVSGTTTLTLPTAANNTNLYTVKNVGTGVVTIACTGLETIDGSTTITLPVQYTSVDLISDNTTWKIT